MSISEKIEAVNNKREQNKAQYDLDRQIAKISVIMNFLLAKMFYQKKTC